MTAKPSDGLNLKMFQLSKPQLLIAQDPHKPELPALPTSHLILPDVGLQAYYGEEFNCLLIATRKSDKHFEEKEHIKFTARFQTASGAIQTFAPSSHELTATLHSAIKTINSQLNFPGKWTLSVDVLHEFQLEIKRYSQSYDIEVKPAISIRFKVSNGSSSIKANILEAQVENITGSSLVIESCILSPQNGWTIESPDEEVGNVVLRPREVYQYSFLLRGGQTPEAGPLAVSWRREPLGIKGHQTTAPVRI